MMSRRHKGTGIAPIVSVLRTHPQRETLVPAHLQKYFEQSVLVSGWYPEDEYFQLLEILSKAFDRKDFGGDPWTQMGIMGARRDIGGVETIEGPARAAHIGIYKHYASAEGGVAMFFQRADKVWTQYHDTGHYEIVGRMGQNAVVRRLVDFHVKLHNYTRLQAAYVQEYARLVGIEMTVTVLRSTAKGDAHCEWLCRLDRSPPTLAYIAALPEYAP
jgi:hypothetical protein